jgi:preprotein translocase subunit YajC
MMAVSGLAMLIPFIFMIGSIVLFVMFVFAHRRMAKAQTEIAKHLGEISKKMKSE